MTQNSFDSFLERKSRISKPKLKFIQSYHSFRWTGRHNPDWVNAETRDKYLNTRLKNTNKQQMSVCLYIETSKQRRDK